MHNFYIVQYYDGRWHTTKECPSLTEAVDEVRYHIQNNLRSRILRTQSFIEYDEQGNIDKRM